MPYGKHGCKYLCMPNHRWAMLVKETLYSDIRQNACFLNILVLGGDIGWARYRPDWHLPWGLGPAARAHQCLLQWGYRWEHVHCMSSFAAGYEMWSNLAYRDVLSMKCFCSIKLGFLIDVMHNSIHLPRACYQHNKVPKCEQYFPRLIVEIQILWDDV